MKTIQLILFTAALTTLISCGKEKKKEETFEYKRTQTEQKQEPQSTTQNANTGIDLNNKGIGPITSITLAPEIDQAMVAKGEETYKAMCTACHRVGKKFIGPAPDGIFERRSPEWIMNMILNPEEMTQKDPIAKQLLIEYNGAPMANQNLTQEQARTVLEYFRTLK